MKDILDFVRKLIEMYASSVASSLDNCNGLVAEAIGNGSSCGTPSQSSSGEGREVRRFDRFLQENIQTQRLKSDHGGDGRDEHNSKPYVCRVRSVNESDSHNKQRHYVPKSICQVHLVLVTSISPQTLQIHMDAVM
ncbi:hypothetical protein QJS10_CPB21g00143 [Acorus calamus]|uniref:Uncharacterized protein n=1 Tax=Acorus calamus TaxID=4465 RepID=A0AAV9C3A0_ACOCL|nr:hypothetical protein QJS10_CPB21g00143 [Acorus calamus]